MPSALVRRSTTPCALSPIHDADATQLDSCVGSAVCIGHYSAFITRETGELSQWHCHDDTTINIVLGIIIVPYSMVGSCYAT